MPGVGRRGKGASVSRPDPHSAELELRRLRRLALLHSLEEAAGLRARTRPRKERLERARALLHKRHTRG